MASNTFTGHSTAGRRLAKVVFVSAILMGSVVSMAVPAGAAQDVWYDMPNYGSSDGDVIVTDFVVSSYTWYGKVSFNRVGGSYCTYIQAQGTTTLGLDGGWFRLTPNRCSSGSTKVTYSWSKDFTLGYDGMAFRICGDKPYAADPCASSKVNVRH